MKLTITPNNPQSYSTHIEGSVPQANIVVDIK